MSRKHEIRREVLFEEQEVLLRDGRMVRVRQARSTDAELFFRFINGLSGASRDFMHGWNRVTGQEKKHAENLAAKTNSDDHCALVAVVSEPQECIVGYCWIDGLKGTDIPMLGIGVIDAYQNAGLGRILLRLMIKHANKTGIERVKLGVWADNPRAIHVYRSVGFHEEKEILPKDFDGRTELYLVVETER